MELTVQKKSYFTRRLMEWHQHSNTRSLPWKEEKDPYRIWLSEVILQQTRAEQGLPYYLRFTAAYPTVNDLAAAADEDAFRLWQGLGYYNRCKNMLATARIISEQMGGNFPDSYDGLMGLKGIGPYTASAIASFAFNLPHAVVDGNVYRVLSRYFGIETPVDSSDGKKMFGTLAQEILYKQHSAAYNQAIMDLGATVCTPQSPKCTECPLRSKCTALAEGTIPFLPVKEKKIVVKNRFFHFVLIRYKELVWIHKREGRDIWQNLNQPLLIETTLPLDARQLVQHQAWKEIEESGQGELSYEGSLKQRLTHQLIESRFFSITVKNKPSSLPEGGRWVSLAELKNIALPKTLVAFFTNKGVI